MRPVSAEFQKAARKPVREDRIEGYLGLWASETLFRSYHFNEKHIVQGSLTITDQFPGGKFGFGGAYVRNLSIKLDLEKFGSTMNRTLVNLTDGEIMLFYYLTLEDGSEERVFLGQYFIDSEKSSRKFNVLNITALDGLSKLNTPATAMSNATLYDVYTSACAGVSDAPNTEDFFAELPNGDKTLTFDTSQIQTNRDVLMWLGEFTGTFLRECRNDPPGWDESPLFNSPVGRPELVQIPTKYTASGTSGNFDLTAFKGDNGSIIPADVRFSTDFSDTSIRVTNWKMNFNGNMLASKISWTLAPDTLEGTIELNNNPLLSDYAIYEAQTILDNIRDYGDDLRFCSFKTMFNGNPAIEVGDYVYLEPGGAIDETQYKHYGIVTYYKWRFREKCELRCSTDAAAAYTRPKDDGSGAATFAARDGGAFAGTRAKSQLEKRIDGLENTDHIVFPQVPTNMLKMIDPFTVALVSNGKPSVKFQSIGDALSIILVDYQGNDKSKIHFNPGGITFYDRQNQEAAYLDLDNKYMLINSRKVLTEE